MIEIYIDNKLVELDNTNISLQKEFSDEVENIRTDIEYSYTISLPTSMTNKEIFGFVDTFDVGNKFARLYNAELYVDNTLILSGKFKMTSIDEEHFKGNIYNPKKKTISDILGDRSLNEIKPHMKPMNGLGDFDSTNNYVGKITNDYERVSGITVWRDVEGVADNHVIYPYALHGLPMNIADENPDLDIFTQNLEYGKHSITEDKVFPAFNVVSVLKDMFATEGYNLVGNIFTGENAEYFNRLYQTIQCSYQDYVDKKEVPFFCRVRGTYLNYKNANTSRTLQEVQMWDEGEFTAWDGDDQSQDGKFQYGVDNPWSCGSENNTITTLIDDKHMFQRGSADANTGIIIIPKSGFYRVNLKGTMNYPWRGDQRVYNDDRVTVGGTQDDADCTDLSEQPFEIQLKKGSPQESPKFYSYTFLVPNNTMEYSPDNTAFMDCSDTYVKLGESNANRRFPKNGKTMQIKETSAFSTNDFIAGARLGGSWFSGQWGPAGQGWFQRPQRFCAQGAGLALPKTTNTSVKVLKDDVQQCHPVKADFDQPWKKYYGTYLQVCEEDNNKKYEYAEDTAFCIVKQNDNISAYSNFEGWNVLTGNGTTYQWDTTSDVGKVTYEGAASSSARTISKYEGEWDVNTVVWLEKGDTLYLEALMPYHSKADYEHSTWLRGSEWYDFEHWINHTQINYDLQIGFITSKKEWKPISGDGIKDWEEIALLKLTNVNQFLPNIKCNDYLTKFLKTFNLQLSTVNANTFSIDSSIDGNLMTNVIDIDKLVNVSDAEFKPLKSDSVKQLTWKNDLSETGYVQGDNSPYGDEDFRYPWQESGYTGDYTIVNETNTSGSIKKNESQWSFNWYKGIQFINAPLSTSVLGEYDEDGKPPFSGITAVPVICDNDMWKDGSSYYTYENEAPQTSKTSRLFFLDDGVSQSYLPPYITFIYDKKVDNFTMKETDMYCNLIIPKNILAYNRLDYNKYQNKVFPTKSITERFFNEKINGGYDIEVPVKLTNQQYADVKQGTLFKLNDGLYKVKSIEGHDVNMEDDSTLTITTLE